MDLREAKRIASEDLPPSHPGRQLLQGLPDHMEEAAWDAMLPAVVRLLRQKSEAWG